MAVDLDVIEEEIIASGKCRFSSWGILDEDWYFNPKGLFSPQDSCANMLGLCDARPEEEVYDWGYGTYRFYHDPDDAGPIFEALLAQWEGLDTEAAQNLFPE